MNLYIELNNKVKEPARLRMKRQGFQLKIYSSETEHVYNIANAINASYAGGILSQVNNWDRIEQFFNVKSEECIRDWNKILNYPLYHTDASLKCSSESGTKFEDYPK